MLRLIVAVPAGTMNLVSHGSLFASSSLFKKFTLLESITVNALYFKPQPCGNIIEASVQSISIGQYGHCIIFILRGSVRSILSIAML